MTTVIEKPKIIRKNGRPTAVVLDIRKYQQLLDLLEDKNDLAELQKIKKSRTSFREFKEYLKENV